MIREILLAHIQQKYNRWQAVNQFAKSLEGKVPRRTVYGYLTEGRDCRISSVEKMLTAAGITLSAHFNERAGGASR